MVRKTTSTLYGILIGLVAGTLLLVIGEWLARSSVHFQGVDKALFANPYEAISYFHRPHANGLVAFGVPTYTDQYGFRIPAGYHYPRNQNAVLLLGDSVTFGVGVSEEESFAGLLRAQRKNITIYNAGILGFNTANYLQTATYFLDHTPEIQHIIVFLALNDLDDISSSDIKAYVKQDQAKDLEQAERASLMQRINAYFRARSALFVWLKNAGVDASAEYYRIDASAYDDTIKFNTAMGFLGSLSTLAANKNVKFNIVIMPYEYQLRMTDMPRVPQNKITQFLSAWGISSIDIYACMQSAQKNSRDLFLFADHMHLSSLGHAQAARCIAPLLQ